MPEYIGIIKIRALPPDLTEEDFLAWWPRLAEIEKERYTLAEAHNVVTTAGRNQLLNYIGSANATTLGFAQYFSVGTTVINSVTPGDTAVQGELFRAAPTTITTTTNQITISTVFGPSVANGTYTNCGIYGVNATGTLGSGTLMTHSLYSFTKNNGVQISNDYVISLK